jgi:ABC-type transport system involved in multi-copper enzyme maturation permease subunit
MNVLTPILAIAQNTIRDAVRNKVLYVLLFFGLVMIAASVLIATLSYVERERILQDVGLSAIRLFGTAIAIFLGVGLVHGEVERRSIYTILSKPVSRGQFLLGKYLGLVATLWMQVAIMSLGFVGIALAVDAPLGMPHAVALLLIAAELAVVVAFATLFSSFATPFLAACYSIGLYLVGHLTRDLRLLGSDAGSEAIASATVWLHRLLPDLSAFNRTLEAVHGVPIPGDEVSWALLMGLAWVAGFLLVAIVTFERRDLR